MSVAPQSSLRQSSISLSLELPAVADKSGVGLPAESVVRTIERLQAVSARTQVPVTWVWSGTPPTSFNEISALRSIVKGDLGWSAPPAAKSRVEYRAMFLGWLKQWSQAALSSGKSLRMLVNSGVKISTPYDAVAEAGVTILRDAHVLKRNDTLVAPQPLTNGMWQLPNAAGVQLTTGWIGSTRAAWALQSLLKQVERAPRANIHIRIDAHSQQELGQSAIANWERILGIVAQCRANGVNVALAADTTVAHPRMQRGGKSILRAA
ncbi:MAG: hypothetical protein QM811_31235 [Pirellulales bacterium]